MPNPEAIPQISKQVNGHRAGEPEEPPIVFRRVVIRNYQAGGVASPTQELFPFAPTCRAPQGTAIPFPSIRAAVAAMRRYHLKIEWLEDFRVNPIAIQICVTNESIELIPDSSLKLAG